MIEEKMEGTVDILAALLVLFTAMIDARVSAVLAVVFLVALAGYKFWQGRTAVKR